ncbi:MAG: LysM peptidoglycan-binding domain-containing protein, partial [Armatimonadetes bacterium]|nr:LysM peptidoglycan-binding domain-containing protein [Armatimonadota bacterium]
VAPTAPKPVPPVRATVTAPRSIGRVHVVAKGDTLYALATRYHVSVSSLAHVNRLRDRSMLRVGQRLVVPGGLLVVNSAPVKTDVAPLVVRQGVDTSPLRFVVEALGGSVTWMGPASPKQVTASTKDRGVLTFTIGSPKAMVNDEAVLMDLAAYLEQGRTMLPTRFISEALDVTIEMDEKSGNILVRSNR